ncbi:hypothetical protein CONLIGDRAFT_454305 [Coniochaeta ligniaria NRRL 30616]|uniref:Uncharacterized protein n=1 Tax=Coniochaeta ligniaria NRRL 30616 TaxID=1408157 RepID=A0A1J7IKJ0_9PEZI|nr:hypothetical protein CONLIGDRAFT_454305 [Coniochaeta ligniaria NRRL 30616]
MKALSLSLQAALGSRAGDIRRSKLYIGMECLCWHDVRVVCDANGLLRAYISLCYEKGIKNHPEQARTVEIQELRMFERPPSNPFRIWWGHQQKLPVRSQVAHDPRFKDRSCAVHDMGPGSTTRHRKTKVEFVNRRTAMSGTPGRLCKSFSLAVRAQRPSTRQVWKALNNF